MHLTDKPSSLFECCKCHLMVYPLLLWNCSASLPCDKPKGHYNLTKCLKNMCEGPDTPQGWDKVVHVHRGSWPPFLGNQPPWAPTAQLAANPDPQLQAVHGLSSPGAGLKQQKASKKSAHTVLSLLGRFNMRFFWGTCKYNSRITGQLLGWEHQCRWTPSSEDNIICQVRKLWIYNLIYFRNMNLGQIGWQSMMLPLTPSRNWKLISIWVFFFSKCI